MMQQAIEDYIAVLAAKLPEFKHRRTDVTYITGAEMKLTAQKFDRQGKPFVDEQVYELEVPVLEKLNHDHKLRVAWLAYGLQGIYDYIDEYLTEEQLRQVKNYFMKRYHGQNIPRNRPF